MGCSKCSKSVAHTPPSVMSCAAVVNTHARSDYVTYLNHEGIALNPERMHFDAYVHASSSVITSVKKLKCCICLKDHLHSYPNCGDSVKKKLAA